MRLIKLHVEPSKNYANGAVELMRSLPGVTSCKLELVIDHDTLTTEQREVIRNCDSQQDADGRTLYFIDHKDEPQHEWDNMPTAAEWLAIAAKLQEQS